MITPQPNKFMEIITSRTNIELGQKFLVDETAWFVVESDYISVKDILYLSLTEDKKDLYVDDIENNIANIIDLNKFVLEIQTNEIKIGIEEEYQLEGRIYLNGLLYSENIGLEIIEGRKHISVDENMKVTGVSTGKVQARIYMEDHPEISQDITILIEETAQEPVITYELRGDGSIKWGRTKIYQCIKITNGVEELCPCTYTIEDNDKLLEDFEINGPTVTLTANEDNNVGSIKIIAEFEDNRLEKEVKITSLWV